MSSDYSRLALGTAQFGMDYGISNKEGKVSTNEVGKIMEKAASFGVDTLDTAISYGCSENVLGRYDLSNFFVMSKLPFFDTRLGDPILWLQGHVSKCFQRLNINRLEAFLFHDVRQLEGENGRILYQELFNLKKNGLINSIGVSLYDPHDLSNILDNFDIDIVQVPFNILDTRIVTSGWLSKLKTRGVTVHGRSVFLQGLLLMKPCERPKQFSRWNGLWKHWDQWLGDTQQSALGACLRYSNSNKDFGRLILGVQSLGQLEEVFSTDLTPLRSPPPEIFCDDVLLLNPSNWGLF